MVGRSEADGSRRIFLPIKHFNMSNFPQITSTKIKFLLWPNTHSAELIELED